MRPAFVEWLFASSPAAVRRWVPEERLRADLGAYFDRIWTERAQTRAWVEGYAAACPVRGAHPHDYALREIAIGSDAAVLAGIHFFNQDTTRPFVGVFAQTRDLADDELARAAEELADAFAVFGSRNVRWWSPAERELRHLPGARGDERLVIGRVGDITAAMEPALPDGLAMQPETVSTCYDDYRRAYGDFANRNVLLKTLPRCETRESLQECADRGALFCLRDDGRFAGLMAARPHVIRGIHGWEIVEELLATDYRGKGLAIPMQRFFVSTLDAPRESLVMGEIYDDNLPSLRTACGAGRKDVGGWIFIDA